jgi:hypothetical protein
VAQSESIEDNSHRAGRNGAGVPGQCDRLIKELEAGIAPFVRVIAAVKSIEKLSFAPDDDRLISYVLADILRAFRRDFRGTPRRAIDCVRELAQFELRAKRRPGTAQRPAEAKSVETREMLAAIRNGID